MAGLTTLPQSFLNCEDMADRPYKEDVWKFLNG